MRTTARNVAAFLLALPLLAAIPSYAQRYPSHRPSRAAFGDNVLRARLGLFTPRGHEEYWNDVQLDFTGGKPGDFEDVVGGVDYLHDISPHLALLVSGDFYEGENRLAERNFVDERGRPIDHTATLDLATFNAGLILRLAPVDAPINPYVGAGGGLYSWRLRESGDFVDPFPNPPEIFTTTLEDSGATIGYFALVGIDVPIGPNWSIFAEGRWQRADDELGGDFANFGTLDLSGRQINGGVGWRF